MLLEGDEGPAEVVFRPGQLGSLHHQVAATRLARCGTGSPLPQHFGVLVEEHRRCYYTARTSRCRCVICRRLVWGRVLGIRIEDCRLRAGAHRAERDRGGQGGDHDRADVVGGRQPGIDPAPYPVGTFYYFFSDGIADTSE
jgi:hypothetical protein